MTKWQQIKDGYGLSEVPKSFDLCCSVCQTTKGRLYTTESVAASTLKELRQVIDRARNYTFCRFHAEWMYKDE